jgi:thiosulfate reductase cytochrome b subunit
MTNKQLVKRSIQWILTALVIIYLITGFGITEYRIVEPLTFGLLTKSLAQKIHISIEIPFIVFLISHIWLLPLLKYFRSKKPVNK